MLIREAGARDAATIATLVAAANQDVAERFGLTADNCPKHPSQCTADWVRADLTRGERYFVAEEDAQPVGCVAYERPQPDLAYLNRLSVLLSSRRHGTGERLVRHVIDRARADGVATISIGVIGAHEQLQGWYRKLGFVDGETRRYPHLPFSVRYMSYRLAGGESSPALVGADAPHGHAD
jgi:diamine N-acetyltransferase